MLVQEPAGLRRPWIGGCKASSVKMATLRPWTRVLSGHRRAATRTDLPRCLLCTACRRPLLYQRQERPRFPRHFFWCARCARRYAAWDAWMAPSPRAGCLLDSMPTSLRLNPSPVAPTPDRADDLGLVRVTPVPAPASAALPAAENYDSHGLSDVGLPATPQHKHDHKNNGDRGSGLNALGRR
jgi:hypothetical protein